MRNSERGTNGNGNGNDLRTERRTPSVVAVSSAFRAPRSAFYCALIGGLMWCLAFPPVDLGWLAPVATMPLLVAIGMCRRRRGVLAFTFIGGMAAFVPAMWWLASVSWFAPLGAAFYMTCYLAVGTGLAAWFQRRLGPWWPLAAAAALTLAEFARAGVFPQFPWLMLGYTQYRYGMLLQMSAIGGVYLLSFMLYFVGASLAGVALTLWCPVGRNARMLRVPMAMLAAALLLMAGGAGAGAAMRARVALVDGPLVGVIQQNTPKKVSEYFPHMAGLTPEKRLKELRGQVDVAMTQMAGLEAVGPDLVVWPEGSLSAPIDLRGDLFSPGVRDIPDVVACRYARERLKQWGASRPELRYLIGAPGLTAESMANRVVLLSNDAVPEAHYDKVNLVPFGEYVPLVKEFPFLSKLTPFGRGLDAGAGAVVFDLPGAVPARFSALICYDDCFPSLARSCRKKGAQFLVNPTYEGWYHVPGELQQHLAMSVFRAVETRTTMVRAGNTGISCFIDPRGEVYAALPPHKPGSLAARVRIARTESFYVSCGDAVAWLCVAAVFACMCACIRRDTCQGT